jgi:prepilin-type processing-associated H-X9-DG protein
VGAGFIPARTDAPRRNAFQTGTNLVGEYFNGSDAVFACPTDDVKTGKPFLWSDYAAGDALPYKVASSYRFVFGRGSDTGSNDHFFNWRLLSPSSAYPREGTPLPNLEFIDRKITYEPGASTSLSTQTFPGASDQPLAMDSVGEGASGGMALLFRRSSYSSGWGDTSNLQSMHYLYPGANTVYADGHASWRDVKDLRVINGRRLSAGNTHILY